MSSDFTKESLGAIHLAFEIADEEDIPYQEAIKEVYSRYSELPSENSMFGVTDQEELTEYYTALNELDDEIFYEEAYIDGISDVLDLYDQSQSDYLYESDDYDYYSQDDEYYYED